MTIYRHPFFLLFLGIIAVDCSSACLATPRADVAVAARSSMVIVSSEIAPHRDAIGAGVVTVVEPNRIRVLTARHVADRGPVSVWIDGRRLAAEIVRTFAQSDIAVVDAIGVRLDRLRLKAASLAAVITPGSRLLVWGENETGLRLMEASVVSPAYAAPDGSDVARLVSIDCAACTHGDSGGGMFDTTGRLVGILTSRYFSANDRTIAIVGERIDPTLYEIAESPTALSATTAVTP